MRAFCTSPPASEPPRCTQVLARQRTSPPESRNNTKSWPSMRTRTGCSVTLLLHSAAYQKLMNIGVSLRDASLSRLAEFQHEPVGPVTDVLLVHLARAG